MSLLTLRGVTRSVLLADGTPLHILRGVDLDVEAGEYVSIVGRSGTGKSTLLNILGLLDLPTGGDYWVNGVHVGDMGENRRTRARGRGFGFVFQQFNLLPGRNALENTMAPLLYASGAKFWKRRSLATDILRRVGLGERLESMPTQLSGGEQQRVAIARALVRGPRVILCDEPTGALDVDTGNEIMSMLQRVAEETNAALVVITHDLAIASRAHTHYQLADGVLHPIQIERREVGTLEVDGTGDTGLQGGLAPAPVPAEVEDRLVGPLEDEVFGPPDEPQAEPHDEPQAEPHDEPQAEPHDGPQDGPFDGADAPAPSERAAEVTP